MSIGIGSTWDEDYRSEQAEKYIPLGYAIMRNIKFRVGTPSVNGTEWQDMETGFQIDCYKKKLYKYESSAIDALEQLKKFNPQDEYEIHPVYWRGR